MKTTYYKVAGSLAVLSIFAFGAVAHADHSWGGYHWARTANPVNLKLGNNLSTSWSPYLTLVSADWNASAVINTNVVSGSTNPKNCKAVSGRVEVCNSKYGNNGWLGIASVWVSSAHITQATVKLNDTYYVTKKYNTPAWRRMVMCQEVAHAFGLDHQDEVFSNPNLGTCMDYTDDPDGTLKNQLSNLSSNAHDFEELGIIYDHLDSFTTASASTAQRGNPFSEGLSEDPSSWGKEVRRSQGGRSSVYERDFGNGEKVFTFVTWAE
jgi:hypothetical protein